MQTKRPKKDTSRSMRLTKIINLINRRTPYGGITLKELSDKCEVTQRQIRRDLQAIQNEINLDLIKKEQMTVGGKKVTYCFERGYLPSLSPEKATVILLSLLQQRGSALAGHWNDLKDALVATLFKYHYDPQELAVEKLQNRIHIVEEALAEPERVGALFVKLLPAIKDPHRLKIWYYAASGQLTERVVEPYGLICKRQNWYLVAYCLKRDDIRVFRVDQIQDVFPYVSEKFTYPADFKLNEHMAQSWGVINDGKVCRVRLKFKPEVAYRIKGIVYHPSQTLEDLADGSVVVTYHVCGLAEMKTWIVQWGNKVEVLEPRRLREEMYELVGELLEIYRPSNP